MNVATIPLAVVLFAIDIFFTLALIPSRRNVFFDCSVWKEEFFTSCYIAECEETCANPTGACPDGFYPVVEDCRPGCVCAPGFVRDKDGICTVASLVCRYPDLAASFSRDPRWTNPMNSGRRKSRRRRLRLTQ